MIIEADGIYEGWQVLLNRLLQAPVVKPRGLPCREIIGLQLRVKDMSRNIIADPQRKLNYRFLIAEWLWILSGLDKVDIVARYNSQIKQFSDDGQILNGAYGPRLLPQWPYVSRCLMEDEESRQAVMTIWTPSPGRSKDIPCTISLQFLLRAREDKKYLHTIVTMRSSDAWLGIPYDVFNFVQLTQILRSALSHIKRQPIKLGELVLNLGSSHLYEANWETARSIINAPTGKDLRSPELPVTLEKPAGLLEVLLDPTQPEEAYALATMPRPWRDYAQVLRSKTSDEAFLILASLDGGT